MSATTPPEFAALAADAAGIDAAAGSPNEPPRQDAPQPSADVEATAIVDLAAAALAAWFPSTAAVLTPAARQPVALALAPVLEKYGFTMGDLFAQWGPEIRLVMAAAPLAIPLAHAIRQDRQAARREAKPEAQQDAAQPAAGDIFGDEASAQPAP